MAADKPVIIVTGSSGFIGHEACLQLSRGFRVVGFDRPGAPHPPAEADNVPCDLTSDESVRDAVSYVRRTYGPRLASVIHLAAYYDFSGEPSDLYEKITVRGTHRLLAALRTMDAVEQFAFSSTMLVHAPCQPRQKISEDWPLDPRWDYPESKLQAERLILAERGRVPAVLLRIAGVYDYDCHCLPIAHQMQRICERRLTATVFPGDTSTGQSFIHLHDLVALIRLTVEKRASLPPESVYLVGEDQVLSYDELQRMLAWLIHGEPNWETTRIPKAVAKAGAWVQGKIPGVEEPFIKPWMIDFADDHFDLDITRARRQVGWEPEHSLRHALAGMARALKSDPAGFYRENKLEGSPPVAAEPAAAPATRSQ